MAKKDTRTLHEKLRDELENPTIPKITLDEYKALKEQIQFKCPNHHNKHHCNGYGCPTRPDNSWEDYHEECRRSVLAEIKLESIGKTRELWLNGLR